MSIRNLSDAAPPRTAPGQRPVVSFYRNSVPPLDAPRPLCVPALLSVIVVAMAILPIVPQIVGALLGWRGLRLTRDRALQGRRLAWAGLIANLGLLVVWIATLILGTITVLSMINAGKTANQWVYSMRHGDIDAAMALSDPNLSAQDLAKTVDLLEPHRRGQGGIGFVVPGDAMLNTATAFGGMGTADGNGSGYEVRLRREGAEWRVVRFRFYGPPTAPPAPTAPATPPSGPSPMTQPATLPDAP